MNLDPRDQYLVTLRALHPILTRLTHDLNNSLVGILGYGQLLQRQVDESSPFRRYIEVICSQSLDCQRTISKVEGAVERPAATFSEVKMGSVVSGYVALRMAGATSESVRLRCNSVEPLPTLQSDPALVHRALELLVRNATQAMEAASKPLEVEIEVTCDAEQLIVSVQDRGVGLPTQVEAHELFDPTFTRRRAGGGLGLGLIQALQLMRVLHGDVRLASREDGEGTCASLFFPLHVKSTESER